MGHEVVKLKKWGSTPDESGERLNGIQEVSGSIPLISTKNNKPQGQKRFVVFSYPILKRSDT